MADRLAVGYDHTPRPQPPHITTGSSPHCSVTFLRKLHEHAPNSTQFIGFLTLIFSGGILLLLTGLTATSVILGLVFFTPLILISSPIWFPVGAVLFVTIAGFLSLCGFGVTALASASWLYRYFRGLHPPGSDRFDCARSRIANTAGHMKDYACLGIRWVPPQ